MRFLTAGNLLVGTVMILLPWIDVRCDAKGYGTGSLYSQSGIQVAQGAYSPGASLQALASRSEASKLQMQERAHEDVSGGPTPFLWAYVIVLLTGTVVCLIVPIKQWRLIALVCVLLALCVLGIQTAIGFPIERKLAESIANEHDKFEDVKVYAAYQFGYYLAWLFSLTPLLLIALGGIKSPKPKRRSGRDDDVDEDEDRPARLRRDEDDDDDRPAPGGRSTEDNPFQ